MKTAAPVIVTMGASCAGKTSWARSGSSSTVLSFDDYIDDPDGAPPEVAVAASEAFVRDIGLAVSRDERRPVVLDQHSLDPLTRSIARGFADAADRPAILVVFAAPLAVLRARARAMPVLTSPMRAARVEHTFRLMQEQVPAAVLEGWDVVTSPDRFGAP